jgi:L-malate glycosyltransferase
MKSAPRVVCAHLFDDFSGSGKVFAQAISELKQAGADVEVLVGSAGKSGFIRSAHRAATVPYRFTERRWLLLLLFASAQLFLFLRVTWACLLRRVDVVYANTVLAPGAVLAGWLWRRRVVVHLHEVGLGSRALFRSLLAVARRFADRRICVSEYMRRALALPDHAATVIYNSLPEPEWERAANICSERQARSDQTFVVMMASSLKWYKGVDSFLALAAMLDGQAGENGNIQCRLVLNCNPAEWQAFAAQNAIPPNVSVVLRPADIYQHYGEASLVLNLSHPEGWIETFGMTLLEAMACGVPVISPTIGGCTELFADGTGGWRIDARDIDGLARRVFELASDRQLWLTHSRAARANSRHFSPQMFSDRLRAVLLGCQPPSPEPRPGSSGEGIGQP